MPDLSSLNLDFSDDDINTLTIYFKSFLIVLSVTIILLSIRSILMASSKNLLLSVFIAPFVFALASFIKDVIIILLNSYFIKMSVSDIIFAIIMSYFHVPILIVVYSLRGSGFLLYLIVFCTLFILFSIGAVYAMNFEEKNKESQNVWILCGTIIFIVTHLAFYIQLKFTDFIFRVDDIKTDNEELEKKELEKKEFERKELERKELERKEFGRNK